MKILIVGAGIGGLSAYHAFRKHVLPLDPSTTIAIVESHPSPLGNGAGLGFAPNGLRAISSLSPSAMDYIRERGFSGGLLSFRNSRGKLLGVLKAGSTERYGEFTQVMVRRSVVHEALLDGVDKGDLRLGMKVKSARVLEEEDRVQVDYEDGTLEIVDLVVGADGVRSVIKDGLYNGEKKAEYDGLTSFGSFIPLSDLPQRLRDGLKEHGVTMTFGRKGFFGYSMCSSPELSSPPLSNPSPPFIQWWATHEIPSLQEATTMEHAAIKTQLTELYGGWESQYDSQGEEEGYQVYKRLIELGCRDSADTKDALPFDSSLLVLPRYITPRLPYWSNTSDSDAPGKGRILLMGDAAHTMPPDSGQGASCAVEDAVVYALFLKHYIQSEAKSSAKVTFSNEAFERAAKAYEALRKPRVHRILDVSKRQGDAKKELGWLAQWIRDFAMSILCKLPESMHDELFAYDAQKAVDEYLN